MCGIAGILRIHSPGVEVAPPGVAIPEAWLDILDESIKHRGPDGEGRFRDRVVRTDGCTVDVALVHRRLSIIDHAGGHQPMVLGAGLGGTAPGGTALQSGDSASPDTGQKPGATSEAYRRTAEHALRPCPRCAAKGRTTVAVVFNGCIYNHRELRRELEAAGHEFSTDHSDTEVLVHGWGEWGDSLPRRLHSMFAFMVWDAASGVLFAARDRFGEKPLYQSNSFHMGRIAFASAAGGLERVLRRWNTQSGNVNASALHTWVWRGFGDSQPFTDITAINAGRYCVAPAKPSPHTGMLDLFPTHWGMWPRAFAKHSGSAGLVLDAHRTEELLRQAVHRRLEADVPLGCFLSGGIDSSLVSLMAREARGSLRTLCVRMPDSRFDESAHASRVAALIGSQHETVDIAMNPAADLQSLIVQLGLPFGDSSLLPMYWVSRAAREHLRVVVTGDGGDELFFGYERYPACTLLRRYGWGMRFLPEGLLDQRNPKARSAKLARLVDAARHCGYWDLQAVFPSSRLRRLTRGPLSPSLDTSQRYRLTPDEARWLDLMDYLPSDLMRKSDTASMSVGLEVRSPFLDSDLADAAVASPASVLMPRGQRKGLLRAVARKYLPAEIVDRPKMGFAIPIGEWFRTDYGGMRQLLLDHLRGPEPFGPDHLGIGPMIRMPFVERMIREHDAAGEASIMPWKGRDHSQRLYMMLVLSIWAKWLGSL